MEWLDQLGEAISDLNPVSLVASGLGKLVGAVFDVFAAMISSAIAAIVKEFATMWMNVPTPDIAGDGAESVMVDGNEDVTQILSWVKWLCLFIAVIALMIAGVRFAIRSRHGNAAREGGRIGMILSAVVVVCAAAGLVSAALSSGPTGVGGAVAMVQANLWWYMQAAAVLSIMIGMGRMMWQMRAEEGRNTIRSIIRLIIVAGASPAAVSILLAAGDSLSSAVIDAAADEDFGTSLSKALLFSTSLPGGAVMTLVIGLFILLGQIIQIVVMIARSGLLVLMMSILPLASANTNTSWGQQWYQRAVGWLAAFILYKPVASIIYAICFKMIGGNAFGTEEGSISGVLVGFAFMVMAILAMPALMKFAVPAISAVSNGGSGGGMIAAVAPTGAMTIAQMGRASTDRGSDGGSRSQTTQRPSGSSDVPASASPSSVGASPVSSATTGAAGSAGVAGSAGAAGASGPGGALGTAGPVGVAAGAIVQGGMTVKSQVESMASEPTGSTGMPTASSATGYDGQSINGETHDIQGTGPTGS